MALPCSKNRSEFAMLVLKASHQCETIRVAIRCVRRCVNQELSYTEIQAKEAILESIERAMRLVGRAMKLRRSPDMTTAGFRLDALRDSAAFEQFLASQASMSEELADLTGHSANENQMNTARSLSNFPLQSYRASPRDARSSCDCRPTLLSRRFLRERNSHPDSGLHSRQWFGESCSKERSRCNMARNKPDVRKKLDAERTDRGVDSRPSCQARVCGPYPKVDECDGQTVRASLAGT